MKPEILKALELFDEADNLAKDWLIQSWNLIDEDKEIAKLEYQKACKERGKLLNRLVGLTQYQNNENANGFESVGSILTRKHYDFLRGGVKNED